ncbi:MAG: lipid-A-disaccharide synthase [Desulfobacterota bacterium]|nr:lipid-A-disaccharide synthase [Thermodesulfobacteriota bacterium]
MNRSNPGGPVKQIGIVAGEASGDLHGSLLVEALQRSGRPLRFFGLGGARLGRRGVEMVSPPPLNVVGFTEVFFRIGQIFRAFQRMKRALVSRRADLLILIDYPDLNLRLARFAHKHRVPVLFYISPQVWAWRTGRVETIRRFVDRLAVILPFEEEFFKARGLAVEFVGHPLLDLLPPGAGGPEAEIPEGDPDRRQRVALLPGSRPAEVQRILPVLLETARRLTEQFPGRLEFLLPLAPTLDPGAVQACLDPLRQEGVAIRLLSGEERDQWKRCDLALVASGTVTLEAALWGVPTIIVYKVSPVNYWIAQRLIQVPYIGLVNWVAGKKIVAELIQDQATPEALIDEARSLLTDQGRRAALQRELARVKEKIGGPGASDRVARIALEMLDA